jgi:Mg-chelatase subunit ChlD
MASLIAALDHMEAPSKPILTQRGENGHTEYMWSNAESIDDFTPLHGNCSLSRINRPLMSDLEEKMCKELIVQFYFQLVRKKDTSELSSKLSELLRSRYIYNYLSPSNPDDNTTYLHILYRMIGQTRDIIEGKGEYHLTYMQIYEWYQVFPEMAKRAMETLVLHDKEGEHPYGSWKDMKYLCDYIKTHQSNPSCEYHPLILHAIQVINRQLWNDSTEPDSGRLTLVAKWIPREGSPYGWLYNLLVKDYFAAYYTKAKNHESVIKAHNKAKMNYRKLVSNLNRRLDTVQIKQCANAWNTIDHSHNTSITMTRQKRAFLNLNKKGTQRTIKDDRVECAENFKTYIRESIENKTEVKGKRVSMVDFVKAALAPVQSPEEMDLLNSQWRSNSQQTGSLDNFVALVDVSSSMHGDPLHAAIGLGIRIAEKSRLGKRVLTFETNPTWVNLEQSATFIEMVGAVNRASWGGSTDLYKAFEKVLFAITSKRLQPEEVENMVFVILSDMQINDSQSYQLPSFQSLYANIKQMYMQAGCNFMGKPYSVPHLVFWNLRSTSGFPTVTSEPNVSMVSGFSPAILNQFCEKGIDALKTCTPWNQMLDTLKTPRYDVFDEILRLIFPTL